ncbi:flagellar hook-length control protein FliK [Phenylobacterium sp.]|uniref:flagellar hook-length control protein FliK n=1 Tax=Phenylobacterium sp. TaxID=1871053 RepID=UPI002BC261FD|nr:flagellar hook-length control protein FliK [Phenylobacterium sp.]HLZ75835.1 flagellar hook-length control protein FliK [Phenylobacterium sp.]
MSAAAINTATTPVPGATGAAGPTAGLGTGAAHGAQASGLPAIFQAMLATLAQAEDAATGGAASAQVTAGGKLLTGTIKAGTIKTATPDDGKTKAKTAGAADSQAAAATTGTATTGAATAPDATVALLVPAVTTAPAQVTPKTAEGGEEATDQATVPTGVLSGKVRALPVATPLVQTADAGDAAKTATAKTAVAAAALAPSGAAVNANEKPDATPAQTQTQTQAQTQTAPAIPAPTDPAAAAPAAAGVPVAPALLAANAATTLASNAKTATTPTPVDGKASTPKAARADAPKAPAGPADTTALSANTAGKNADALAPIVSGGGKAGAADKDGQAALDAEAGADQPAPSQAPGDPATASTTTPATVIAAAAAAVRGSPQTVANLAAQIVKKLDARSTQFDVQLDPAGLGKVDVRVEIGADGKMSAAMSFDTPQAAAELRSRSVELQQALAQSGFDVSGGMSFDVSTDRGQNGQAQNQQQDSGAAFRGRAFQAALDTTADTPPVSQLSLRRTSASGVDIRI